MPLQRSPVKMGESEKEENKENKEENMSACSSTKNVVEDSVINATSIIKLPPFWKENPSLWFDQVEMIFALSKISADETKFRYVIINLDTTILPFISDILKQPPKTNKYETLKSRIIGSFDETNESKLRRLLGTHQIGDERPSNFLQKLRNLAAGQCSDSVLRTLFLEQIPESVRAVLVVSETLDLSKLAIQADKIMEMVKPSGNLSTCYEVANKEKLIDPVQKELEDLRLRIQQLEKRNYAGRNRSRSSSRNARKRSTSRECNNNNQSGLCYYHSKFGKDSWKCKQPCTWKNTVTPSQEN
ncbi:uncharacterized protein [Prorops nasuta]|uniref:uncharacterized protein n=1 Tax=Prorops nasuta TaxID=863751 RepID=UPI0034CD0A8C